ncbi:MAG TPA: hypothetical protein DCM86_06205 [Verrucomicrobiales bacterium]|nr:hypothetical protein [Verrucomicrobiales bacterium]
MKTSPAPAPGATPRTLEGFTLLEVMVACFVFFTVAFSVLELTTHSLVAAKKLRRQTVDPAMQLEEYVGTNVHVEPGVVTGDFGDIYPDYTWERDIDQVESNGLYIVKLTIFPKHGSQELPMQLTSYLYDRAGTPGRNFGGMK